MSKTVKETVEVSKIVTAMALLAGGLRAYTKENKWVTEVPDKEEGLIEKLGKFFVHKPTIIEFVLKQTPEWVIERYGMDHTKGAIVGLINAIEQLHQGKKLQRALKEQREKENGKPSPNPKP
jgi:hypothetical protein